MAAIKNYISSFNAGELSPRMLARPDVSQYHSGCRILENFLVTTYGSIERRPGTMAISVFNEGLESTYEEVENTDEEGNITYDKVLVHEVTEDERRAYRENMRLAKFIFNRDNAYIILFKPDGCVVFDANTQLKVATIESENYPFNGLDLSLLAFAQSGDIIFIVHPEKAPQLLKRTSASTFTFSEMEFEYPPVLDENTDKYHVLWNTAQAKGATTEIYSWKEEFTEASVGRYLQIRQTKDSNRLQGQFDKDSTSYISAQLEVFGSWTLTTHGTWTGELALQRSLDGGSTWDVYATISSAKDNNAALSGTEDNEGAIYRLVMEGYEQSSSGTIKACKYTLDNSSYVATGIVKITGYTNAQHVTGTIIKKLSAIKTTTIKNGKPSKFKAGNVYWSWGAFHSGCYPQAISFYESRLYIGGTADNPDRLWGSRVNDYTNFLLKADEDDAGLDFTLASQTVSTIRWMLAKGALIIGTSDSEWTIGAQSSTRGALTASDLKCTRQSAYGSAPNCQALLVENNVIFLQRGARKLRVFSYSWEQDNYIAEDLTVFAEHILNAKVKTIALQTNPDTIVWVLLQDGTIAALTYDAAQKVVGWTRITRMGFCRALEVVPGNDEDRVYMLMDYTDDHADYYRTLSLEVMFPRKVDEDKKKYYPYLDGATFFDATLCEDGVIDEDMYNEILASDTKPENFDTGIRSLLNLPPSAIQNFFVDSTTGQINTNPSVGVTWDNAQFTDERSVVPMTDKRGNVIPDGDLDTYQRYMAKPKQYGWLGLKYESVVSPMPPQLQLQEGFSTLRKKSVAQVRISTYGSVGGKIKIDDGLWQDIPAFDKSTDKMDTQLQPADMTFTGTSWGGYKYENEIIIKQDAPQPFNLSSILVAINVTE